MISEMPTPPRIQVVDSHTGGEPTRVVISGGPDLGTGTVLVLLESAKPVIHPLVNNVNNRILSFIFMGSVGF